MGNTNSSVEQLIKKVSPKMTTRTINVSISQDFKHNIPIPNSDLIKNLSIPNSNFKSVYINIGSAQDEFKYCKETNSWVYADPIPLFKVDPTECGILIYENKGPLQDSPKNLNIQYDCAQLPEKIKKECRELTHRNILYTDQGAF
jgi:hypothetical protein